MTTKYQPRFVAYAKAHGRTPNAQIKHDTGKYPGGKMCGFILWISEQRQKFKRQHPDCFLSDVICDQDRWTRFLIDAAA
jgi:hypothetical protein